MYQVSYSEVLADSPADARQNERLAFDHAIQLLQAADGGEPQGEAHIRALSFVTQLWSLFIKDLADPGNDLAPELKARLISVGIWIMSEAQRIQGGQSRDFAGIAEICGMIRDGLR